jgi:flagellar hook assembly protein FlgD
VLEWTVVRVVARTAQPSVFFVSDPDSGYSVADGPTPAPIGGAVDFEVGPAQPNPFASATTVSFALPAEQRADVAITDIAGRRVRSLAGRVFPAGRHTARWDGSDDAGRPAASGVYFLVVEAGERRVVRKVVLVRD